MMRQFEGYLPEEILVNVLQRLPLKSLLRFQCVSKSWRSLIMDSSLKLKFQSTPYSILHQCPTCRCPDQNSSVWDSHGFHRLKFHPCDQFNVDDHIEDHHHLTTKLHNFDRYRVLGSSNGLICFANEYWDLFFAGSDAMYLWNPGIKRYKRVRFLQSRYQHHCPNSGDKVMFDGCIVKIGFGFCGINGFNDYRLLFISFHVRNWGPPSCQGHVNVYSLASDSWKRIPCANVPRVLASYTHWWGTYASVGRVYYWLVIHTKRDTYSLVAFDLVNETFLDNVELPRPFHPSSIDRLYLFELSGSVALYEFTNEFTKGCLWVSANYNSNSDDHDAPKEITWSKLLTIQVNDVKELFIDERLPHSLQMMLKHDPRNLFKQDRSFHVINDVPSHERYTGTYFKSLALLGVAGGINGFPSGDEYYLLDEHATLAYK